MASSRDFLQAASAATVSASVNVAVGEGLFSTTDRFSELAGAVEQVMSTAMIGRSSVPVSS
jgi:hypothetical protein